MRDPARSGPPFQLSGPTGRAEPLAWYMADVSLLTHYKFVRQIYTEYETYQLKGGTSAGIYQPCMPPGLKYADTIEILFDHKHH